MTLSEIRAILDAGEFKKLFIDEFFWSNPPTGPTITVQSEAIQLQPVAQAAGIPVFLIRSESLPGVTKRREVHRTLVPLHAEHLLIYATEDESACQFVWAKTRDGKKAEIRVLPYAKGEPARTTLQQLQELQLELGKDIGLIELRRNIDSAFAVEGLTKQFFEDYKVVFNQVEAAVKAQFATADLARRFTQTFFNRLLFVCFLQKKGWLEAPQAKSRADYLFELYQTFTPITTGPVPEKGFYDRLRLLFFSGLNSPNGQGGGGKERDDRIGDVPFLNGGLFEADLEIDKGGIVISAEAFQALLGPDGLLRRYNFTISESTPDDVIIALDPELLGKIFEELVNDRHETGSYYTPRPIVSFMCREALKGYLGGYEKLVDEHDPEGISVTEAKQLIKKLEAVKVCDPACGSGAYLVGMLHEIEALLQILDTRADQATARDDHERRLLIIQNCLYGVDLQKFAVNIAWLRLWLALIIEETRNPLDDSNPDGSQVDVSLPNLDVKIGVGDSLMAPVQYENLAVEIVRQFAEEKAAYMRAHTKAEKDDLRAKIAKSKEAIRSFSAQIIPDGAFDWIIEFAEVWSPRDDTVTVGGRLNLGFLGGQGELVETTGRQGGFDIILANPPYVRADAQFKHLLPDLASQQAAINQWKEFRENLKKSKQYETLHEKWDLYIPFLERSHRLLAQGGQMVFIIPDAYNTAKYAGKSHEYFLKNTTIARLDFCSDIPLFRAGVFNTILHFWAKLPNGADTSIRVKHSGDSPDDFFTSSEVLPTAAQQVLASRTFRLNPSEIHLEGDFIPVAEICYISAGMVLHADEKRAKGQFTTSDLISPSRDALHPKPFFRGKDMVRWCSPTPSYLEWGTSRAPTLFRRPTFPELYGVPEKLISMDLAGGRPRVTYDNRQLMHNHSAWSFVPWHALQGVRNESIKKTVRYADESGRKDPRMPQNRDDLEATSRRFMILYLLALMNSAPGAQWMQANRTNRMHIFPDDWRGFPVPDVTESEQTKLATLVQKCLDMKATDPTADVSAVEEEIDARVEFLYFHSHEAPDYDTWLAQREAEKGTVVESVRNLIRAGEGATVEFKESFSWDMKKDEPGGYLRDVVHSEICSMLNAQGGDLLIGVQDDRKIVGVAKDLKRYGSLDKLLLAIESPLGQSLTPNPIGLVDIRGVEIDGQTIIRIRILQDSSDRYKFKGDIYVRTNTGMKKLTPDEAAAWWSRRIRGDA